MKTKKTHQKQSDKLLLEEVQGIAADEVVDAIATSIPGINIAYKLAKAYFGRAMKLRQHRALEWVEFVRDNLGKFSKQLFANEQFQDCFVLLTEGYIRERAKYKRKLYQQILLGIAKLNPEELEKFQLERMVAVTNQISFEALNVLYFIKLKLLKQIELDIQKQLSVFKDREGVEGIRLENITRDRIIVSEYISKWIYENYNINRKKVKTKHNFSEKSPKELRDKITYEEHLKERELIKPLFELSNLGLLRSRNGTATFGGTVGSGYSISEFGYEYLNFLDKENF